jgi:hypothetical protein
VRDEADPGEDLIRLDHDLVDAVDPLDPRRTMRPRPAIDDRLTILPLVCAFMTGTTAW